MKMMKMIMPELSDFGGSSAVVPGSVGADSRRRGAGNIREANEPKEAAMERPYMRSVLPVFPCSWKNVVLPGVGTFSAVIDELTANNTAIEAELQACNEKVSEQMQV